MNGAIVRNLLDNNDASTLQYLFTLLKEGNVMEVWSEAVRGNTEAHNVLDEIVQFQKNKNDGGKHMNRILGLIGRKKQIAIVPWGAIRWLVRHNEIDNLSWIFGAVANGYIYKVKIRVNILFWNYYADNEYPDYDNKDLYYKDKNKANLTEVEKVLMYFATNTAKCFLLRNATQKGYYHTVNMIASLKDSLLYEDTEVFFHILRHWSCDGINILIDSGAISPKSPEFCSLIGDILWAVDYNTVELLLNYEWVPAGKGVLLCSLSDIRKASVILPFYKNSEISALILDLHGDRVENMSIDVFKLLIEKGWSPSGEKVLLCSLSDDRKAALILQFYENSEINAYVCPHNIRNCSSDILEHLLQRSAAKKAILCGSLSDARKMELILQHYTDLEINMFMERFPMLYQLDCKAFELLLERGWNPSGEGIFHASMTDIHIMKLILPYYKCSAIDAFLSHMNIWDIRRFPIENLQLLVEYGWVPTVSSKVFFKVVVSKCDVKCLEKMIDNICYGHSHVDLISALLTITFNEIILIRQSIIKFQNIISDDVLKAVIQSGKYCKFVMLLKYAHQPDYTKLVEIILNGRHYLQGSLFNQWCEEMLTKIEQSDSIIKNIGEWRPRRHTRYPPGYRNALHTLVNLAKTQY